MKKFIGFFDADFFSSVGLGFFISAFVYQIYLLLFVSFFVFFFSVFLSQMEIDDVKSHIFGGDELEQLKIKIIKYEDTLGQNFLFLKDGFEIFKDIKYRNHTYEFFEEGYKLNLKEFTGDNYVLLYPGVLYKKNNI